MNDTKKFVLYTTVFFYFSLLQPACVKTNESLQSSLPEIFLPEGASAEWILPPLKKELLPQDGWKDLRFSVDSSGHVWLSHNRSEIINPADSIRFQVKGGFDDFIVLERALVFSTDTDLAVIPSLAEKAEHGLVPIVTLQPLTRLPVREARLFPLKGSSFYIAGSSLDGRNFKIYLRRKLMLKNLFITDVPVSAVAGNGEKTYAAMGGVIVELKPGAKEADVIFTHPRADITSLAYSGDGGLFYSTAEGVGCIGAGGSSEFIKASSPIITIRKEILYVLLQSSLGVLKIIGIDKLKNVVSNQPVPHSN